MKLCQLIAQNGEDSEIYCTCIVAVENEQDIAGIHATCGGAIEDCQAVEITTVADKDGNAFRPILLPQYRLEAKLIRKQTEVRCDEPGCDWSLSVEPESVLEWHNVRCPKCGRGVIINDNEAEVFRQILAASEPDTGEKGLLELEIDTAILREAKSDEA